MGGGLTPPQKKGSAMARGRIVGHPAGPKRTFKLWATHVEPFFTQPGIRIVGQPLGVEPAVQIDGPLFLEGELRGSNGRGTAGRGPWRRWKGGASGPPNPRGSHRQAPAGRGDGVGENHHQNTTWGGNSLGQGVRGRGTCSMYLPPPSREVVAQQRRSDRDLWQLPIQPPWGTFHI